jgi:hypothetical protein
MNRAILGVAAALATMPLTASHAWSSPCVTASVSTYTASGFNCTVDGLSFSDFSVTASPASAIASATFSPVQFLFKWSARKWSRFELQSSCRTGIIW